MKTNTTFPTAYPSVTNTITGDVTEKQAIERKDGYFKEGIFYSPRYAIFRNGELLEPLGIGFGYPYQQTHHILIHLQEVSNDNFTLEPIAWKAQAGYDEVGELVT